MNTLRHTLRYAGAGLLLALLGGCANTPYWDAHFGEAVEFARAQQVLNPDAGQNPDPVAGIDGRAAHESVEAYERGFRTQQPQASPFSIGISGSNSR